MNAKKITMVLAILVAVAVATTLMVAQGPPAGGPGGGQGGPGAGPGGPGGGGRGPGGPGGGGGGGRQGGGGGRGATFTVTSTAWPDGDVIPAKYVYSGGKMSPPFDFKWVAAGADAMPPMTLQSYAIVFHDIENAQDRNTGEDTLHWMIWDIPGTAKGLAEGLAGGAPEGSVQPTANIGRGSYFGPGAPAGPYHHYVFEFYALDIKLGLPASATRAQAMDAMKGHVIGKAAYVGRYHS